MSDLVERLRSVDWDYLIINNLCHEAADELERMQAVVDAARGIDWATLNALERALIAAKALDGEP